MPSTYASHFVGEFDRRSDVSRFGSADSPISIADQDIYQAIVNKKRADLRKPRTDVPADAAIPSKKKAPDAQYRKMNGSAPAARSSFLSMTVGAQRRASPAPFRSHDQLPRDNRPAATFQPLEDKNRHDVYTSTQTTSSVHPDRERDRDIDRERDRERDKDRDRDRDSRTGERDDGRDRERDRGREKDHDRERDRYDGGDRNRSSTHEPSPHYSEERRPHVLLPTEPYHGSSTSSSGNVDRGVSSHPDDRDRYGSSSYRSPSYEHDYPGRRYENDGGGGGGRGSSYPSASSSQYEAERRALLVKVHVLAEAGFPLGNLDALTNDDIRFLIEMTEKEYVWSGQANIAKTLLLLPANAISQVVSMMTHGAVDMEGDPSKHNGFSERWGKMVNENPYAIRKLSKRLFAPKKGKGGGDGEDGPDPIKSLLFGFGTAFALSALQNSNHAGLSRFATQAESWVNGVKHLLDNFRKQAPTGLFNEDAESGPATTTGNRSAIFNSTYPSNNAPTANGPLPASSFSVPPAPSFVNLPVSQQPGMWNPQPSAPPLPAPVFPTAAKDTLSSLPAALPVATTNSIPALAPPSSSSSSVKPFGAESIAVPPSPAPFSQVPGYAAGPNGAPAKRRNFPPLFV